MAFCVKCGQPIEGSFCGACGADNRAAAPAEQASVAETPVEQVPVAAAPVEQAPAAGMPYEQVTTAPAKKGLPKWVIPAAIAVVAVIIGVVLFFALGGTKIGMSDAQLIQARVDSFESAFENGDWNGVLSCMDSETRAMIESSPEAAQMSSYFGMIRGMITCDFEVHDIEIEGNEAIAEVDMTMTVFGQSQSESETIPFVKEGGDWYMAGGTDMLDF